MLQANPFVKRVNRDKYVDQFLNEYNFDERY